MPLDIEPTQIEPVEMEATPVEVVVQPEPQAQPGLDEAAIARIGAEIAKNMPKPKEEPAPPMTPEEAKKVLKVWEPTDEWLQKFGNLETQKAAIAELRDGVIGQAAVLAQTFAAENARRMEEQYKPVQRFVQQLQAEQQDARFARFRPDIVKDEFRPIIKSVAEAVLAKNPTFKSEEEYFNAVANGVDGVLKSINPEHKPAVRRQPSNANALPVSTPGTGGGGAGNGEGSGGSSGPRGIDLFAKVG